MKKIFIFLTPLLVSVIIYLPILLNPSLVLNRQNDLDGFFWPVVFFIKQQIILNQQFPLWNNLFLSGMPLLPDPQSPLFYPPNIIFLILPIGIAFIISFIAHTALGGLGMFLLTRSLGIKQSSSVFAALIYMCAPRFFGYLDAGHFGLVTSFAWIPFAFFSTIKLTKRPQVTWSIALAVSLAAIFYTHVLTFIIVAMASVVLIVGLKLRSFPYLISSGIITFGLVAIALLPQLEWLPFTTRQLLLGTREVFPQWNSFAEFTKSIIWPWGQINQLDSEKWLPLGISTTILGTFGFLNLNRKLKLLVLVCGSITLLIVLTNLSPIYSIILNQDWFVMLRVATRVWFIPILLTIILAAYGLDILAKSGWPKKLIVFVAIVCFLETLALSWTRITKPIERTEKYVPAEIYDYLIRDKSKFRVYCTNRCIPQKEAAINNIELVEGYNTIQQKNYYKEAWQLTGAYWNYYTLSIPPIGTYTFEKPQPDAISLGEFNTKYVISPYELTDKEFKLENRFGGYFVYKNEAYLPRAYFQGDDQKPGSEAPIKKYSSNHIQVNTSRHETQRLVLAEVWSPGWNAYLNGKEKISVQEKPNALRLVDIRQDTNFVEFKYEPKTFELSRSITLLTLFILATYGLVKWKKSHQGIIR